MGLLKSRIVALCALVLVLGSCASARYARGLTAQEIHERFDTLGNGTMFVDSFPSGERYIATRRIVAYLPPSYYEDTLRRYPVVYVLHGARGNEVTWMERGNALGSLDSLVQEGKVRECIVVFPNMNRYYNQKEYRNGRAVNATRAFFMLNGEAERHFDRVMSAVDTMLRTIPDKQHRAICGMSSGGLQSLYIAANRPDTFGYVGLFSPYTYPTFAAWGHRDVYSRLWHKLSRQFKDPPQVYHIYIGKADFFYPHIGLFHRKLSRKGYPHKYTATPGGHEWYNWTPYLAAFYEEIFKEDEE